MYRDVQNFKSILIRVGMFKIQNINRKSKKNILGMHFKSAKYLVLRQIMQISSQTQKEKEKMFKIRERGSFNYV